MSIYNSSIDTRILEPVNHNNSRTEFRLGGNGEMYLSNLRLINVTGKSSAGSQALLSAGYKSIIKSIYLYSGNQLLDQVVDFNLVDVYRSLNHDNATSCSVVGSLSGGMGGYELDGSNEWDTVGAYPQLGGDSVVQSFRFATADFSGFPTTDTDTNKSAWVDLQDVFPFLRSALHLPTNILRNLGVVIHYNSLAELNGGAGGIRNATAFTPYQPLLIVDELVDGEEKVALERSFKGIVWDATELDRVVLNAVTNGGDVSSVQNKTFLMRGFDNKYVSKMVVIQQPVLPASYQGSNGATYNNIVTGRFGSMSQFEPQYQFRINGQNKIQGEGLVGYNRRMAMLVDTCGEFNNLIGGATPSLVAQADTLNGNNNQDNIGYTDYTGVPIEEYVNEFQLTIQRTTQGSNPRLESQIFVSVMANCRKSLRVNPDGSFNISY